MSRRNFLPSAAVYDSSVTLHKNGSLHFRRKALLTFAKKFLIVCSQKFLLFRQITIIGIFVFILNGCALVANFDGVMALKRLGESQRDNEKYVRQQEKLFYKLVSEIKDSRLEKGLSEDKVFSRYGQPVSSQSVENNQQIKKVLVYRHPTRYFSSEKAYLYFDEKEQLSSWELKY